MVKDLVPRDNMDIVIEMSDLMMIMMMLIFASLLPAIATSTAQTARVMQAMQLEGRSLDKTFVVTDKLAYWDLVSNEPFTSVRYAEVENDGPNDVKVAVNYPDDTHLIEAGRDYGFDKYLAEEKISAIFFKCRGGETAVVRVRVEY
ncbi:unnamed protein product [marine sediment metagenome]|uniref:Uncharacterized protein n=1 Tax=marine sediment metagenome TaxID=412755 RepID=X1MAI4_9ZZZZ